MGLIRKFGKNLGTVFSFALTAVSQACPDCTLKNSGGVIEPQTVTAKMALSDNTLFLIVVVIGVLGFMVWMMVKTCRELTKESDLRPGTCRP
jgi:heme/copper-type cytochrome/quinol oxidase subunit 2